MTSQSKTTKTVRFYKAGDASVLKLEDMPVQAPVDDEIRIAVEAIGLNRAEVMFREGQYLETPDFPSKLGYEASGVIDAVGPDADGFKVGDRVSTIPAFSMGQYGVYGEQIIVPARAAAQYPARLSAVEGASIWMQYITAFGGLVEIGKLTSGATVVITAASSSVGLAAIQIAKMLGATVVATTRGKEKKQFLRDAGANHVIVSDDEDLAKRVMDITSDKGANVLFDPVGGPLLETLALAAASRATIIEYGALSSSPTPFPLFVALAKGLTIRGYTLFELTQNDEWLDRSKNFVYEGIESGALKPVIDRTFTFTDIAEAHRYMESNQQKGKIVVTVP
ncbi:Quinone oxidoreductase [hydrothermal vent metagenome]|uniref:Quinone oxidoreductase n=1 Tax=hydrothermal vent metagenome TaxID=652676 RepID=A0A3B0YNN7_9ZZZZ